MKTKTLTLDEWLSIQKKLTYVEVADHHTALKITRRLEAGVQNQGDPLAVLESVERIINEADHEY